MIVLHQPPPCWGLPSMSPFCVKLETYLRMAKIEYQTGPVNIFKAPNGRVPYIKMDGKYWGDSTLIIEELKKKFGDPLDSQFTEEQKARGLAIKLLVENHLYYAGSWLRWNDEESWAFVRDVFKKMVPGPLYKFVIRKIRKDAIGILSLQGMGEHPREQIIDFAKEDLKALSVLLGNNPFVLGDQPTTFDATLYGFLVQLMWIPWNSPVKEYALTLKNLVAYCERMKSQYWAV